MITVLIATGTMNAGGAETLIMEMLRQKSDAVRYVLLIHHAGAVMPGVYDQKIQALGVPVLYIPSVGSAGAGMYSRIFQERIAEIGPVDILHCHLNAVGGIIAKAAKEAGIITRIVHCHADITYTGSRLSILLNEIKLTLMKRYVNRYATAYWACSEAAGRRLFDPGKPVKVIPNVIDVQKYLCDTEKHNEAKRRLGFAGRFVLGSVGRIAPIKNYEFVFSILSVLNTIGIIADFVCFGRATNEDYFCKLTERAKELGVEGQVHFMGNSNQVAQDIACFDVFLMPSLSEGFGMAAIEAQAAGIPSIVSEGVPMLVDVGLNLILFLPFEAERWAEKICELKDMKRPTSQQILSAFSSAGYNSPEAVQKVEAEYQKLCRT